jgi:hypothetical protein
MGNKFMSRDAVKYMLIFVNFNRVVKSAVCYSETCEGHGVKYGGRLLAWLKGCSYFCAYEYQHISISRKRQLIAFKKKVLCISGSD